MESRFGRVLALIVLSGIGISAVLRDIMSAGMGCGYPMSLKRDRWRALILSLKYS